jgi:hypothetical protein
MGVFMVTQNERTLALVNALRDMVEEVVKVQLEALRDRVDELEGLDVDELKRDMQSLQEKLDELDEEESLDLGVQSEYDLNEKIDERASELLKRALSRALEF